MSVLVGVRDMATGDMVVCTDSLHNFDKHQLGPPNVEDAKVVAGPKVLVGVSGWFHWLHILGLEAEHLPHLHGANSIYAFFIAMLKRLRSKADVFVEPKSEGSPFIDMGADFIVGTPEGLFHVSADVSVTRINEYIAIGSGSSFALGSLWSTSPGNPFGKALEPDERAWCAVCAACEFDQYSSLPCREYRYKPEVGWKRPEEMPLSKGENHG